jgi:hypothetical protein
MPRKHSSQRKHLKPKAVLRLPDLEIKVGQKRVGFALLAVSECAGRPLIPFVRHGALYLLTRLNGYENSIRPLFDGLLLNSLILRVCNRRGRLLAKSETRHP